jgi:hypothetical protein
MLLKLKGVDNKRGNRNLWFTCPALIPFEAKWVPDKPAPRGMQTVSMKNVSLQWMLNSHRSSGCRSSECYAQNESSKTEKEVFSRVWKTHKHVLKRETSTSWVDCLTWLLAGQSVSHMHSKSWETVLACNFKWCWWKDFLNMDTKTCKTKSHIGSQSRSQHKFKMQIITLLLGTLQSMTLSLKTLWKYWCTRSNLL